MSISVDDRVLLIGAGGLGCGAALALAAGGARQLMVIDDDVVDESNLHRQILHAEASVGQPKAESLAASLHERFPEVQVTPVLGRFEAASALRLLHGCAVAIDGSDNLATKFLANDAAVLARIPLVHGAAVEGWGQLMTVPAGGRPCYRCLFEELPSPDADAPSCAEAGVLGPVPGVIGALQAAEALRILRGESPALTGRLIRYDSRLMTMRAVRFRRNPECGVCGDRPWITSTSLDPNRSTQQECAS
jgi:molybdopterin/thiamine biosynthesis adenylyltransferase